MSRRLGERCRATLAAVREVSDRLGSSTLPRHQRPRYSPQCVEAFACFERACAAASGRDVPSRPPSELPPELRVAMPPPEKGRR